MATSPFRTIATGLRSPEGPVVLADGSVAVVESMASRVSRITPDGDVGVIAVTGDGPNGLASDAAGALFVANNGGLGHPRKHAGALQRIGPDGAVSVVVGGLDAPNDVCVAADGSVWFTDPRDSWFDAELRPGRVHRWQGTDEVAHEGLDYPNGLGFDPDGVLVVAESRTGWLHHLVGGASEPWVRCPEGAPDGFCFSSDGLCVVCCFDVASIFVVQDGVVVDRLRTEDGTWPTNCALTPNGTLVVTESAQGRLLAFDLGLTPLMELAA
jgi:gluconolactonase